MNTQPSFEQRAVTYLRIASRHPNDTTTIAHQREGCLRIAARHGLTIIREYLDLGRPAVFEQQGELRRLLDNLAHRRDAAFVVVWDYARLGRSLEQLNDVCNRIHTCGSQVLTISGVEAAHRFVRERQDRGEVAND